MTAQEIKRTLQREFVRTLRKPFVAAVREYGLVRPSDRMRSASPAARTRCCSPCCCRICSARWTLTSCSSRWTQVTRRRAARGSRRTRAAGIPLEIFDTNVLRVAGVHSAEHPCFLCAKMRRGYLYAEARKRGCNKIALGHHYDDAIGTVLMGLIYGGQVQAMLPRVRPRITRAWS